MTARQGSHMRLLRFEDLDEYTPEGHHGVVNRLLVGLANGGDGSLSIWHGRLEPGGRSDLHIHEESLQVYVGLAGEMTVGDGEREALLNELTTAVFEKGSRHFIANRTTRPAEVLVISVPGLR